MNDDYENRIYERNGVEWGDRLHEAFSKEYFEDVYGDPEFQRDKDGSRMVMATNVYFRDQKFEALAITDMSNFSFTNCTFENCIITGALRNGYFKDCLFVNGCLSLRDCVNVEVHDFEISSVDDVFFLKEFRS